MVSLGEEHWCDSLQPPKKAGLSNPNYRSGPSRPERQTGPLKVGKEEVWSHYKQESANETVVPGRRDRPAWIGVDACRHPFLRHADRAVPVDRLARVNE